MAALLCVLAPLPAQAEQAQLQGYGQADGLGNLAVMALAQDSDGYIWAGTQNGLYRFDGLRFRRVGREEGLVDIVSLVADRRGGLWIGTGNGLYHWHSGTVHGVARADGRPLPVEDASALALDPSGTLWVVSAEQLYEVRSLPGKPAWVVSEGLDPPTPEDPRPTLRAVAASLDGTVWLICNSALCRRDGRQSKQVAIGTGALAEQYWGTLLPAHDGSVWLRSPTRVAHWRPGDDSLVDQPLDHAAAGSPETSFPLAQDRLGRVITAGSHALARQSPASSSQPWQIFDRTRGMPPGGRFVALLADREGGVWLSRAGTGLWHWRGYERWEHWTSADGLPHDVVWAITRDHANVLHVGTSAGMARFDTRTRRFQTAPETAGVRITSLRSDPSGTVWVATVDGRLLRSRPAPSTALDTVATAESMINSSLLRSDGTLWFVDYMGAGSWPAAAVRSTRIAEAPTRLDNTGPAQNLCEQPDGTLWLATGVGLLRVDANGTVTRPAARELQGRIKTLACSQGTGPLYVADERGHIHQVETAGTPAQVTDITPPLLTDRVVLALAKDRRGWRGRVERPTLAHDRPIARPDLERHVRRRPVRRQRRQHVDQHEPGPVAPVGSSLPLHGHAGGRAHQRSPP
jgi:ligand-binding sensor domain-containing protein